MACHVTLRLGVIHAMENDTTLPSHGLCVLMTARGQTRSFGDVGPMSGFPKSGNAWAIYEYTSFCNGPGDVKSPRVMSRAELTLLSVVGAEAATLCCQKER